MHPDITRFQMSFAWKQGVHWLDPGFHTRADTLFCMKSGKTRVPQVSRKVYDKRMEGLDMEAKKSGLRYQLTIRLFFEGKSFGPGPMKLLEGVEQTGSLSHAARNMGMAYSKAWKMIRDLEKEWGFPILVKQPGGLHGGGSYLTEAGRDLLERYRSMLDEVHDAADKALKKNFPE